MCRTVKLASTNKNLKGALILPKETRSIFPAVICTSHFAPRTSLALTRRCIANFVRAVSCLPSAARQAPFILRLVSRRGIRRNDG